MSIQPKPEDSLEDSLAAERECRDEKQEYVCGRVFAMVGATYNHKLIDANLTRWLATQLKSRPCVALSSDMRLRIQAAEACCYPDVAVLCDPPLFHDGRKDVLTDATLVAEVLSSTEGYDRSGKHMAISISAVAIRAHGPSSAPLAWTRNLAPPP